MYRSAAAARAAEGDEAASAPAMGSQLGPQGPAFVGAARCRAFLCRFCVFYLLSSPTEYRKTSRPSVSLLALRALGGGSDARGRALAARAALSVHARARSRHHPHLAPSPAALLPLSTEALAADHVLGSGFAVSSAVAATIPDARERGWNARAVRGRQTRPPQDDGMADGIRDCAGECQQSVCASRILRARPSLRGHAPDEL